MSLLHPSSPPLATGDSAAHLPALWRPWVSSPRRGAAELLCTVPSSEVQRSRQPHQLVPGHATHQAARVVRPLILSWHWQQGKARLPYLETMTTDEDLCLSRVFCSWEREKEASSQLFFNRKEGPLSWSSPFRDGSNTPRWPPLLP